MPAIKRDGSTSRVESLGAPLFYPMPHSTMSQSSTSTLMTDEIVGLDNHDSPSNRRKKQTARSDKTWDATYQRLIEYKLQHGDCLVPWRYEQDPQLGNWVKEQRKKKKNDSLAPERQERLERIGFVWRVQQNHRVEAWENVFERLCQYKEKHGNCMVPSNYKEDVKLGRWVSMQRFRQEKLSPERKKKLELIGFV